MGIAAAAENVTGDPLAAVILPTAEARAFVAGRYEASVADYLVGGDGFKVVGGVLRASHGAGGLSSLWAGTLAELAAAGYMRRSRTGRYWWQP